MQLGERLRVELALFGVLPRDLAQRSGYSEAYISRVLSGERTPPPATVRKLIEGIHRDVLEPAGEAPAPELVSAAR